MPEEETPQIGGKTWTLPELADALLERDTLAKQLEDVRDRTRQQNIRYVEFQSKVHRAIADLVSNDELDRDTANEVLDDLGLDRLAVEYTVEVVIGATLTVESWLDADDLSLALRDSKPDVEWSDYGSDWAVEDVDHVHIDVQEVSEG